MLAHAKDRANLAHVSVESSTRLSRLYLWQMTQRNGATETALEIRSHPGSREICMRPREIVRRVDVLVADRGHHRSMLAVNRAQVRPVGTLRAVAYVGHR